MAGLPGVLKATVTAISGSGTIATATLDKSLDVAVGDRIVISGAIPLLYNGTKTVRTVVVNGNGTSTVTFSSTETGSLLTDSAVAVKASRTTSTSYTTAATGDGFNATLTLTDPIDAGIGDTITVSGMTPSGYNGDWVIGSFTDTAPYKVTFKCAAKGAQTSQGTVKAHTKIYESGDWSNVGTGLSRLSTLNRGNVETALKAQVQSSTGWQNASQIMFGDGALDPTLPFPLALIKAVVRAITRGIMAPASIEEALGDIENFMNQFVDDAGKVVGDLSFGVMDGSKTVSNFLTELWQAITGQSGSNKTVSNVTNAMGQLKNTTDEAVKNATDAQDLAFDVISSGSNLIKNPGFESFWFQQLGSSFSGPNEPRHSGNHALKITGNGVFTNSYVLLSDDSIQRFLTVAPGEVFYAEVWVCGKSTNQQTSNGANAIKFLFEPFDASNNPLEESYFSLTASTAFNNTWKQLAGYVTMPPGAVRLKVSLQLAPTVPITDSYYFDDVVVREVTLAKEAHTKAKKALVDPVESSRLPVVPVANIGDTNPNLLTGGSFDDAATLDTAGNFSWDPEGRTKAGSAKVVADGTAKTLLSNIISVVGGQSLDISCYLKWSGVAASSGDSFKLSVVNYSSGVTGTVVDIDKKIGPASSSSWTLLSGSYTVPSTGVDSIRIRLKVVETVTAGTILWDDVSAAKKGILPGGLVRGADNGTILDNVQTTWNSFVAGFSNIGSVIANVTGLDFSQTVSETSETIAANALAITKLQTTATYNANSGIQEFINFSDADHVPGSSVSTLGSKWAQLYDGSGSGTLGVSSGRATWNWVNNANRLCIARYTGKASLTDYQRIGVAYASAPGKDIFGNQAFNYIYGRMGAGSTLASQTYVYAKLGKNSCEVGCVVNGSPIVFETKTSFSFKANSVYWLECGQLGGLNQIRLIDNNGNAIISYTDNKGPNQSMQSVADSSHRWAGLGGFAFANGIGHFEPGSMLAFSVADNSPQPVVGSGMRRYRDSTTGVNLTAGTNLLEGSFFDTTDGNTGEYEYTHSENKIKVLKAGWYCVSLAIKFSDFLTYPFNSITVAPVLYKMGNVYAFGSEALGAGGGGNYRIAHTWIVYLNENEHVQPGYHANLDPAQNAIGSDNGAETFWQISLLNWSLT